MPVRRFENFISDKFSFIRNYDEVFTVSITIKGVSEFGEEHVVCRDYILSLGSRSLLLFVHQIK